MKQVFAVPKTLSNDYSMTVDLKGKKPTAKVYISRVDGKPIKYFNGVSHPIIGGFLIASKESINMTITFEEYITCEYLAITDPEGKMCNLFGGKIKNTNKVVLPYKGYFPNIVREVSSTDRVLLYNIKKGKNESSPFNPYDIKDFQIEVEVEDNYHKFNFEAIGTEIKLTAVYV